MDVTKSGNPIGPEVTLHMPGPFPSRVSLEGRLTTLEPLSPAHTDDLFACLCGSDRAHLWDYVSSGPFEEREPFANLIRLQSQLEHELFFAVRERKSGKAVGYIALLNIDPKHRSVEVGHVIFSPLLQRTVGATESMYLMARYVFDTLGYRRYEWKCNNLNAASRRAAERLGFTFEGVFRQHMVIKGRNRDTAWFSMLDSEWPDAKRAFEAWLDPRNFDEQGKQVVGLVALRESLREGGSRQN
jgi:RimJ/RimL family protein N-acetyltransferase